jgi:hypothetical protein
VDGTMLCDAGASADFYGSLHLTRLFNLPDTDGAATIVAE